MGAGTGGQGSTQWLGGTHTVRMGACVTLGVILILILALTVPGRGEPQSEGVVTPSCCAQIFVSSSGLLAQTQSAALGIYTLSSQKIAGNPRPVYLKSEEGQDYYLYYRDKEDGPKGWLVGPQLLEDTFYLTTTQEGSNCPAGLSGAFDTSSERDDTFVIDCHSDQVKVPCCEHVQVSATGAVSANQGAVLGDYTKAGDVNGHTAYIGGYVNASLFYRKAGFGPDGWMIGPEVGNNIFMVTTRNKQFCPNEVMEGFDRDKESDTSLRIECKVPEESLSQDPGIPVTPLVVEPLSNRKSIGSSAREILIDSACFRLLCIVYLLLESYA